MEIVHVSAECFPVAKAGGLGDVVGALPKYQIKAGHYAKVVMPMYRTPFLYAHEWQVDFKGYTNMGNRWFEYTVIKEKNNILGFDLFLIDIYGLLDREKIYGYSDDAERFTAFQIAFVHWINHWQHTPHIVHCHDYHAGLIPFMFQHCYAYQQKLSKIPTVLTIHNAQYQGWMGWDKSIYIPAYDTWKTGLLDWKNTINPLASGIKCAWKVTTVSPSYLEELKYNSNGLEALFEYEKGKCTGILNGIDTDVWNPETDKLIVQNYNIASVHANKQINKQHLCAQFNLDSTKPLFIFIGRLVGEKAADILADAIVASIYTFDGNINFLILGSGEAHIEWQLTQLIDHFPGSYNAVIGYNETLSHQMYASADFLLMPSRVEPCGLNQLYAMRYATVPIVRRTGGLKDTVIDVGDDGWGICFNQATSSDLIYSIGRAFDIYYNHPELLQKMRNKMMPINHSWLHAAEEYIQLYQSIQT